MSSFRAENSGGDWNRFYHELDTEGNAKFRGVLGADQGRLCAYCEVTLDSGRGAIQVEHFHPKDPAKANCPRYGSRTDWGVRWTNLLAVCKGGEGTPRDLSCDKPKENQDLCDEILNPLEMGSEVYFAFDPMSGEIRVSDTCPDEMRDRAAASIQKLNLNCRRLKQGRATVIAELDMLILTTAQAIESKGIEADVAIELAKRDLAQALLGGPDWPPYFSAQRWALGDAAEKVLADSSFCG